MSVSLVSGVSILSYYPKQIHMATETMYVLNTALRQTQHKDMEREEGVNLHTMEQRKEALVG